MSKAVSPHNSGIFPPPVAGCAGICRKSGATGAKKEAMTTSWLLLSMGYEKDGFVFLIDGFEPPKLTNLSHSIQHCPEANHPNNE